MIKIKNLTKKYGSKYALKNVSFNVLPGQITGFIGENGAGKSTTLNILLNITHPTSGSATIDNKLYKKYPLPIKKVGAVLDYKTGLAHLKAYDHLLSIAKIYGLDKSKVDSALEKVALTKEKNKRIGKFSLGMGQRLTIAQALLFDPEILILDEPFNGIDPRGIIMLKELLLKYKAEGKTVFLSSHQLSDVAQICDKVVVITEGKIVADDTVDNIVKNSKRKFSLAANEFENAYLDLIAESDESLGQTGASESSSQTNLTESPPNQDQTNSNNNPNQTDIL
jgi:ABC-2 type transport system ATP-binding protein